ncbi:MAG: hypothetical protein ACE5IR_04170 [bacterium]
MKLGQTVTKQLGSELGVSKEKQLNYEKQLDGLTLRFEIVDSDKFSFLIKCIQLDSVKEWDFADLEKRAQILAEKLTYLTEDLIIVETDTENGKIQLRSDSPEKTHDKTSFFEIMMETTGVVKFERIQFESQTNVKSSVSFQLTKEVFQRLLNHLAEALSG